MSLRYIMGKTGCGKTTQCIKEIVQKDSMSKTLLYIVPEQFSMESERLLVSACEKGVIMNTSVFSFRHLAYHLISKNGTKGKAMLDDVSKAMLARKITWSLSDKLEFFGRSLDKQGFIDDLCSTIGELIRYNVSPKAIADSLEHMENGNLKMKLKDICLIYSAYMEYLDREYISKDDMLNLLAEYIAESDMCRDEVWIDGFMGFTPQEYSVIEKLLECAERVNIALDINGKMTSYSNINPFDPYYKTKCTVNRLTALAENKGIRIEKPLYMDKNHRQKSEALIHLSENYLSYMPKTYEGNTKSIEIYKGSSRYSEIDLVCRSIIKLVRDKGWSYKDIAVISGSPDYEIPLCHSLNKYNIPNFLDKRRSIMSHPLTELIISAVDTAAANFSNSALFSFLKTGYVPIDENDVFTLENYVLANGIKNYMWKNKEWIYGFGDEYDHDEINNIKNNAVKLLSPLTDNISVNKKYSIREIIKRVNELITSIGADKKHDEIIEKNEKENDLSAAMINRSVWNIISDVFEKADAILGNEKATLKEFSKILKAGLSTATIGVIPAVQDMLIIGDIGRTILPQVKALFMMGVSEGSVPSYKEVKGIFNDTEREYLSANAFEVAPNSIQEINSERFEIFSCMAKPTDYLCLTYPSGSIGGEALSPSPVIYKILDIFKDMDIISIDEEKLTADDIASKEQAFDMLVNEISRADKLTPLYRDIYNYFMEDKEYSQRLRNITESLSRQTETEYLDEAITNSLYSENVISSISRLETFARCPYSFFMKYIIKARERAVYEIKPRDTGNIYHYVLEDFSRQLREKGKDWRSLDQSETEAIINGCVDNITASMDTDILSSTSRYKQLVKRVKRILNRSVWALSEQIKEGLFEPLGYEIGFGPHEKLPPIVIELKNGRKMVLTGKIDRVDIMEKDGKVYSRIIDYKSSDKDISLTDLYYGIQLQLPVYIDAFVRSMPKTDKKEYVPAGMFYFHVNDPVIDSLPYDSQEKAASLLLSSYSMKGLVLKDNDVFMAMDKENRINERGRKVGISGIMKASAVTDSEFEQLRSFVNNAVKDMGSDLTLGNVRISPLLSSRACDFCSYGEICRYGYGRGKERKEDCASSNVWQKIRERNEQ